MATPAHCVFCFEALSANLDRSNALKLDQVQDWWDQYTRFQRGSPEAEDDEDEEEEVHGVPERDEAPLSIPRARFGASHLAVPSPSSASPSSTPSSMSTSSSRIQPSSTPASSPNSSRSSLFSFAKRPSRQQAIPNEARPLFVTWNTVSRTGRKSLRGCIGTFEAQELENGLKSYALTSAFDDSRFLPITKRELSSLEVGVTLLTDFETASTPTSWDLGTHGLRISFTYHSKRYGATYLPNVPVEQGWAKEETLVSLMRKAGWTGKENEWRKVGDLKVVRYQGQKVALGYEEWMEWRQWVAKQGLI
ncbi:MAG: hypothetical protein M1837_002862 [Sclerophora amabilis]|nr:MAG: hypothetical protein M1837_002862 [Sclerophora amabilis]